MKQCLVSGAAFFYGMEKEGRGFIQSIEWYSSTVRNAPKILADLPGAKIAFC